MNPSPGRQALALAAEGRTAEALAHIETHAGSGDPEALFVRGLWRVEGKLLDRDLGLARRDLTSAAESGHVGAARIVGGFIAAGIGAPRNWQQAIAWLERWSATDPMAGRQRQLIAKMELDEEGNPTLRSEPRRLCETPEVNLFTLFFCADECDFLVEAASQRFRPALIFHEAKRQFIKDPIRDSDTASFPLAFEYPVVHALNRRIAAATATRIEQGETLQLLRYRPGQQYKPHLDAIPGMENQRILTMIVWLNDNYSGGETHFLETDLRVRGEKGDALMFRNAFPDGRPDPAARHAGLAVTEGEKLIASRWIRQRPPSGPEDSFGPHEAEQSAGRS